MLRFGRWLESRNVLSADGQAAARKRISETIRAAIASEEAAGPPAASTLFDDVYAKPTWLIAEQKAELLK
jgi:TPP-dependent pyruvate/acetoin dehydrogenase alpha subunit